MIRKLVARAIPLFHDGQHNLVKEQSLYSLLKLALYALFKRGLDTNSILKGYKNEEQNQTIVI